MEQVGFFLKDFSSHCDVDLEDRNTGMSHGSPGHGDVPTHQVSLTLLHKAKGFRRYRQDKYSLRI